MSNYIYKGDGAGIPGIPQVVTDAIADKFNAEQAKQFKAAVSEGVYVQEPLKQASTQDEATAVARKSKKFKSTATEEGESS